MSHDTNRLCEHILTINVNSFIQIIALNSKHFSKIEVTESPQ